MPDRVVALIAGASGSGKSRLARLTGWPILRLDDFYRDGTEPGLPRGANGLVDWDDARAWDASAAADALAALSRAGTVEAPLYSIADNAAVGSHVIDAADAPAVVAEGIFAIPMLEACRVREVPTVAIWLDRHRWMTWWRRLRRDIVQHRKPLGVLLRRGVALCLAEPALKRSAIEAGFEPMTMRRAQRALRSLSDKTR